jgi:hypothetical protein
MSQLALSESQPARVVEELDTFCVGLRPRGLKRKSGRNRVNREVHARICGGLEVKSPPTTRLTGFIPNTRQYVGISKKLATQNLGFETTTNQPN